jgi:hypothetical protein
MTDYKNLTWNSVPLVHNYRLIRKHWRRIVNIQIIAARNFCNTGNLNRMRSFTNDPPVLTRSPVVVYR